MTFELLRQDAAVVSYHDGGEVERVLSPRPYLMATTPGGTPVTEVFPEDHLHHLGVSLALPDVNGTSFWGGRTYRRGEGSIMLDNHGVQRVLSREPVADGFVEQLAWLDREGGILLEETREITAREDDGCWNVTWVSQLAAVSGEVSFGSPQTNGREGAFYGGIFWRTSFGVAQARCADGEGEDAAHGSTSPWLQIDSGSGASLVAATSTGLPWFVRSSGYVGFLPAVAVEERRVLPAGETLRLDLAVSIADAPAKDPEGVAGRLLAGLHADV